MGKLAFRRGIQGLWSRLGRLPSGLWVALMVFAVGLTISLVTWFTQPTPPQPPASFQAHQEIVARVIASTDRSTLIGNSPTQGNLQARVVLVKFSDFECPYCAITAARLDPFIKRHGEDLLFVYKHLPLTTIHAEALASAQAAWAAQQQGQFWLYHDGLFANQNRLGEGLYLELAEAMHLDRQRFNRDRASPAAVAAITKDQALAEKLQLQATPSFIMNDLLIPGGAPVELFEEIFQQIQEALPPVN